MRCTQPYGLPDRAQAFLREHAVPNNRCPHCNRDDGWEAEVVGKYGMFGEMELLRYPLQDGRTAQEYVQHEVWSSGPMVWLALKVQDGPDLRWDDDEIG